MMKKHAIVAIVAGVLTLTGCGNFYRGMYEGLQKHEQIKNPASQTGKPAEPAVTYDQYEKERKKLPEN